MRISFFENYCLLFLLERRKSKDAGFLTTFKQSTEVILLATLPIEKDKMLESQDIKFTRHLLQL